MNSVEFGICGLIVAGLLIVTFIFAFTLGVGYEKLSQPDNDCVSPKLVEVGDSFGYCSLFANEQQNSIVVGSESFDLASSCHTTRTINIGKDYCMKGFNLIEKDVNDVYIEYSIKERYGDE